MKLICIGDSPKNTDGRPCRALSDAITAGNISLQMSGKEGLMTTLARSHNDVIAIQQASFNPSLIKSIRESRIQTPVIVIARSMTPDEIAGTFDAGADEYVTIDISPTELLARLHALVRRSNGIVPEGRYKFGRLVVDERHRDVLVDEKPVVLTRGEFDILLLIARRKGNMISREAIFNSLYAGREHPSGKTLDVMICRIRKKMKGIGIPESITTNWNNGYSLNLEAFSEPGMRLDAVCEEVPDTSIDSSMPLISTGEKWTVTKN